MQAKFTVICEWPDGGTLKPLWSVEGSCVDSEFVAGGDLGRLHELLDISIEQMLHDAAPEQPREGDQNQHLPAPAPIANCPCIYCSRKEEYVEPGSGV